MRAISIVCFPAFLLPACAAPAPLDGGGPTPSSVGTETGAPSASAISPDDPSLSLASCKADSECALTTNPGCCSCCPCAEIHATTIEQLKQEEEACAVVECSMRCDKASVTCPKCVNPAEEGMAARCIRGTCTLVER